MADPVTPILIGSLLLGAAGTTASIIQGNKANKQAQQRVGAIESQSSKQEDDLRKRQDSEEKRRRASEQRAGLRARQKAVGATGRRDTIVTSPLGDVGSTTRSTPTILGS